MTQRIAFRDVASEVFQAFLQFDQRARAGSIDPGLIELIYTRVSMVNGCAYCVDLHTRDARARGESEQRLYGLAAWKDTPFYSEQERAALAWADAVTELAGGDVSDDVYEGARRHFDEKQLVELTALVAAINSWNRLCIAFRSMPKSRGANP